MDPNLRKKFHSNFNILLQSSLKCTLYISSYSRKNLHLLIVKCLVVPDPDLLFTSVPNPSNLKIMDFYFLKEKSNSKQLVQYQKDHLAYFKAPSRKLSFTKALLIYLRRNSLRCVERSLLP